MHKMQHPLPLSTISVPLSMCIFYLLFLFIKINLYVCLVQITGLFPSTLLWHDLLNLISVMVSSPLSLVKRYPLKQFTFFSSWAVPLSPSTHPLKTTILCTSKRILEFWYNSVRLSSVINWTTARLLARPGRIFFSIWNPSNVIRQYVSPWEICLRN